MSGFAVRLDFVEPLHPERQKAIEEAIAYRGPHRRVTRAAGPCTFMHAALWTTPEDEGEDQPQRHVNRDFWLAADARVDNRDELTPLLRDSTSQPLRTDADFLLAAYERWGVDLVDHVVGDFGFALWDGELEQLMVSRDPFGIRPVFLAETPQGVVAASTLPAVLAGAGDQRSIDETYLAGYLHGLPPRDRSIWSGIERLAPGHRHVVSRAGSVTERYWSPDLETSTDSLDTTIERLRHLFDEAVRCRLRTRDGIITDLSGGFDSSAITATAASMTVVRPVSLAYRLDPEAFELDHIDAALDHLGLETILIEADELVTLDPAADTRTHREPLYSIDATDTAARFDVAVELGLSVSLAGVGGDELFRGSWTRRDFMRRRVRGAVIRRAVLHPDGLVAHVAHGLRAKRANRSHPWLRVPPPPWPPSIEGEGLAAGRLATYEGEWQAPAYELVGRLAAERSVDARFPYLDRRLVELGLTLPEEQVRANGKVRGLHRLVSGSSLPPSVASRNDKADFTASFQRRIDSSLDGPQQSAAATALGERVDQRYLSVMTPWPRWNLLSAGLHVTEEFGAC